MCEIKFKPFDLEKVKAGAPVVTASGRPVRVLCFDRNHLAESNIVALVKDPNGEDRVLIFCMDGRYACGNSDFDLRMAPVKKTRWVNIYPPCSDGSCGTVHSSKDLADKAASFDRISCIQVDWEE